MILNRARAALAAKKPQGVTLGNRTKLADAQALGSASNRRAAATFAGKVLPIVRLIGINGATTLRAVAASALHQLSARRGRAPRIGYNLEGNQGCYRGLALCVDVARARSILRPFENEYGALIFWYVGIIDTLGDICPVCERGITEGTGYRVDRLLK